jgi:transposase
VRGDEERQEGIVLLASADDRVPPDHPLRAIRKMVDRALREMSPLLTSLYAERGRVSIPPEYLLRAQLLQILYAIPSERRLCEHIEYNLLFRWFVGLPLTEPMWHHSSFTKNRDRLLCSGVAEVFHAQIRSQAEAHRLLSREHFSVDGTLLEAAASLKSFRPRKEGEETQGKGPSSGGRNPEVNFHGDKRKNATHVSTTDPEARLTRKGKGKEAKLCYCGHILTENRNGLIVEATLTPATGRAEVQAALDLLSLERERRRGPLTVGADAGYNTRHFVDEARARGVTPHVAEKKRGSAIDGRTTSWDGYGIRQRLRKRIAECFGWMKNVGLLRKLRHRGVPRVQALFLFSCVSYNLVRMRRLLAEPSLT